MKAAAYAVFAHPVHNVINVFHALMIHLEPIATLHNAKSAYQVAVNCVYPVKIASNASARNVSHYVPIAFNAKIAFIALKILKDLIAINARIARNACLVKTALLALIKRRKFPEVKHSIQRYEVSTLSIN